VQETTDAGCARYALPRKGRMLCQFLLQREGPQPGCS
jgi:hypothetical protein